MEKTKEMKWGWAGHLSRRYDNRWTKRLEKNKTEEKMGRWNPNIHEHHMG